MEIVKGRWEKIKKENTKDSTNGRKKEARQAKLKTSITLF
jgi:hypothetical protein